MTSWSLLSASISDTVRRILEDGRYQTEFPDAPRPVVRELPDLGPLPTIVRFLFWTFVIIGAVIAISRLVRYLRNREAGGDTDTKAQPTTDLAATGAELTRQPLQDAEALAASGNYAEAIHVLLLRTFDELSSAMNRRLADHLTSREIRRRLELAEHSDRALGDLIRAVEISHFGGTVPTRSDYERCSTRFQELLRQCQP